MTKTNNPRVFVTNYSAHDYSDALRFGELKPITAGSLNLGNTDRLITAAIEETKDSTKDDLLLISGPPIMCALCLAVWMSRHEQCNLLIFESKEREYTVRLVTRDQIELAIKAIG